MKFDEQIPRNALVWIILTQFALLLPHLGRVPPWVLAVYIGAALWRTMVFQGRWSFPSGYIKTLLTMSGMAGVVFSYRTLVGLEPTVAMLLIAYSLKLIELADRRDAYMVTFIAYFVCLTEFLFTQELMVTLYMGVAVWLNTSALIALHQPEQHRFTRGAAVRSGVMLLQAVPLMVLLFFVFPRIGPLWNVPLKTQAARTGVSDFMSPGDIASLGLDDDVAFRVQFEGEIPPRAMLYWRGLVYSTLRDGAWRSLRWRDIPGDARRESPPELTGDSIDYSVIMEPTQQNWLYALRYATTPDRGIMRANDFRLVSPVEVQDQKRYEVRSWPGVPLEAELGDWRRRVETSLPRFGNPRTRALAEAMFADSGRDAERFAQDVLQMFRQQAFFYTLRPPLLEGEKMDQFLFETRRGFCEHYAAAFAWMMRAVDIPARVVAGYQGGEINPVNSTVIVHQFDAHAWNEIWLEGRGWMRVDPTGAIAPDRIEYGLEQALAEEGSFLEATPLSPLRFRQIDWINSLRLRLDAISYSWEVFVLSYDRDTQYQMLDEFLGNITRTQLVISVTVLWATLLLPVLLLLLWRTRGPRLDAHDRIYRDFCARLARAGLQRRREEAPASFALRVAAERPALAGQVASITEAYEALAYREETTPETLAELRRLVRSLKPGGSGA